MRTNAIIIFGLIFFFPPLTFAQATRPAPGDLANILLRQPAPPREYVETNANAIPADDAPMDALTAFWTSEETRNEARLEPTQRVRERMLGECLNAPGDLPALLAYLPQGKSAADLVAAIYEKQKDAKIWDDDQRREIDTWVRQRSGHFRPELIAAAKSLSFGKQSELQHEDDLLALAKLDWETAQPILRDYAANADLHISAVALQMLAEHAAAVGDKAALADLLPRLRQIAEDRNAPSFARDRAFAALESVPWDGRDAWYLSLFSQADMADLPVEGNNGFASPLQRPISDDPRHYIPLVAGLVDGKNSIARENAIEVLQDFADPAALKPLLPALDDQKNFTERTRSRVLKLLAEVDLPEAVPMILKAWPNLQDNDRVAAAHALAHYRAAEAPEKLKHVAPLVRDNMGLDELARDMVDCHALSDEEIIADIEALCSEQAEIHRRRKSGDNNYPDFSPAATLGANVLSLVNQDSELAKKLLRRADALDSSNPALATEIRLQLGKWPVKIVDIDLLGRAVRNPLDEAMISTAVNRLPGIRTAAPELIHGLVLQGGEKRGFAAAILDDPALIQTIFHGEDSAARRMLLLVATPAGTALPIADVAACLDDKDPITASAAEKYLIAIDTPQSRQLVIARHPREYLVFANRSLLNAREQDEWPQKLPGKELRAEMNRADGRAAPPGGRPDEIYAMLSEGGFGNDGQRVIRVHGNQAYLSFETAEGRTVGRSLSADEYAALVKLVTEEKFDDLPDLPNRVWDGVWYTYFHLNAKFGRAIYMNNPGSAGTANTPYYRMTLLFRGFSSTGTMTVHYRAQDHLPGLRILRARDKQAISGVWKQGNDFRVLVGDDENKPAWHFWRDGQIGVASDAPPGDHSMPYDQTEAPEGFGIDWNLCSPRFLAQAGEDLILTGDRWQGSADGQPRGALWRCRSGKTPVRITKGDREFARPIVTADGKWAVAIESVKGWAVLRELVRVRLSDGKVSGCDVPAVGNYEPVARLADGRILVSGSKKPGETEGLVWWKIDAATGKAEKAEGDFTPLTGNSRPLQPALKDATAWAAESDDQGTRIGVYDLGTFKFTPLISLRGLRVGSDAVWVDEGEKMAYLCAEGDLLCVPLPK